MPNPSEIKMEDMSEAYLRALCAANGYSIVKVEHDNDGLDIAVRCKGKAAGDSILVSTEVEIQLKSSYARIRTLKDGSISYDLEVKNYKWLIDNNRMLPLILVVFQMPEDETLWLEQTIDWLKIKKCAYWISLKGKPDTTNEGTVAVHIPAANLLTKDSLKEIMVKVSKRQDL